MGAKKISFRYLGKDLEGAYKNNRDNSEEHNAPTLFDSLVGE